MSSEVIVAIITGGITLLGVIISNSKQSTIVQNELKHLTEEVKKHNNFAQRIPVIENELENQCHRIDKLERSK